MSSLGIYMQHHLPWNVFRRQRRTVDSMMQRAQRERREVRRIRLEAELIAKQAQDRERENHLPETLAALMKPPGAHG